MGDAIGQSLLTLRQVQDIYVVESNDRRVAWLNEHRPEVHVVAIDELIRQCGIIFLAIKPQQFNEVSKQLQGMLFEDQIVVSMMAGISVQKCVDQLGHRLIVRIMPNTAAALNQGVTGLFFSPDISNSDQLMIEALCASFGVVVLLENEAMIHAITALSGSGPAFFYRMVQVFIDFAKDHQLDSNIAGQLVVQTLLGAGKMLQENLDPEILIQQVTSPNGTTFAGLQAMDSGDFDKLMYNVLEHAKDRSIELSEEA